MSAVDPARRLPLQSSLYSVRLRDLDRRTRHSCALGGRAIETKTNDAQPEVAIRRIDFKSQLAAHLEHGRICRKHLPVQLAEAFRTRVGDEVLHQEPAEPFALEVGAHQDGQAGDDRLGGPPSGREPEPR
jgi:hypothetical protein